MRHWIKIETSLAEDPRIERLIKSTLGFAGLGMYVLIRIYIENSNFGRLHINQIVTLGNGKLRPAKIHSLLMDYDLFNVDGNGTVSIKELSPAHASANASANAPADEPFLEETRKEIYNKENFNSCENGNHDFDSRWV